MFDLRFLCRKVLLQMAKRQYLFMELGYLFLELRDRRTKTVEASIDFYFQVLLFCYY